VISKKITTPTVAVIGGGSWATAIVKILSENDVKIKWWVRSKETVTYIKSFNHNPNYLSDVQINTKKVKVDNNIVRVVDGADYVILCVPSAYLKAALEPVTPQMLRGVSVVSAIKGLVPGENMLISDYMEQKYYIDAEDILCIGGPCHSEEVALEKQSFLTVACEDYTNALKFAQLLNCRFVKTHCLTDIYGVEYSAILKNIIAIASGIARGLNYGDNFQAVLVSNAMQEVKRFLDTTKPANRDMNDSAYLGDLLVTCYSQFSRNRTFGNMIGRGYTVKSAQIEMNMVAEGYYGSKCIMDLNKKHEIDLPICRSVYHILYEKINPIIEFQILKSVLR
jgi:glycerol-3-phosphate dehydrogenase (NAD(P)+)